MKNHCICIFEDARIFDFGQLIELRPVWALRSGAFTLGERLAKQFPEAEFTYNPRSNLRSLLAENVPEEKIGFESCDAQSPGTLFINGRAWLNNENVIALKETARSSVFISNGEIVAFRLDKFVDIKKLWDAQGLLQENAIANLPQIELSVKMFRFPWEFVDFAENAIRSDLQLESKIHPLWEIDPPSDCHVRELGNVHVGMELSIRPGAIIDATKNVVRLEENVIVGPGAILDATDGPIWVDEGTEIKAGAMIMGPVYIGKNSIIRPGARLYGGVALGEHCRVGGEVANTIMIGYSSKQHSGYLGSSYIGEWVNFGANTDNSDLKNNYKPVDVTINGRKVNTGSLHVGVIVSDFCRTAIQTRLNTGTVVGICCNLFGSDFPDKAVPSFTWFGADGNMEYRLDKALETIEQVMPRRKRKLTSALRKLLTFHFASTVAERASFAN